MMAREPPVKIADAGGALEVSSWFSLMALNDAQKGAYGSMPQYVLRLTHPPDQCPSANSKVRQMLVKGAPELPALAGKLGVKIIVGPLVLGAEHEAVAVVEADRIEAVQDFVVQSGMVQWNSVRVSAAQTMEESIKELSSLPPPIY